MCENLNNSLTCKCGYEMQERDMVYRVGDDLMCSECAYGYEHRTPFLIVGNEPRQVFEPNKLTAVPNGIYKMLKFDKMFLYYKNITSSGREGIKEAVEQGFPVYERRPGGAMVRFPERLIHSKDSFDLSSCSYADMVYLISCYRLLGKELICSQNAVLGIAAVANSNVYKYSYCSYERGFTLCKPDEFNNNNEEKTMPTTSETIKTALEKITPSDMLRFFEKRIIGQGTEIRKIVYLFYEYLKAAASGKDFRATNWLLTAPSGCGKTEVYRTLRDFFKENEIPIPVFQFDLSQFSESGYKGKDASEIIDAIADADTDIQPDGTAICFLDEADKKFVPSITSSGTDYNAAMQSNLLTLVEGSLHTVKRRGKSPGSLTIDTGKTMFVLMGAFQAIRDQKHKTNTQKATIGFNSADVEMPAEKTDSFFDDISIKEMVEYGMLEELAGRMEQVINLHRLSEEDMRQLIADKAKLVSEEMGVEIQLWERAVDSFLEISYTHFGVRNVTNTIRQLVCDALSSVYFNADFDISQCCIMITARDDAMVGYLDDTGEFYAVTSMTIA